MFGRHTLRAQLEQARYDRDTAEAQLVVAMDRIQALRQRNQQLVEQIVSESMAALEDL